MMLTFLRWTCTVTALGRGPPRAPWRDDATGRRRRLPTFQPPDPASGATGIRPGGDEPDAARVRETCCA
jgi:hypothetical protein